MIVAGVDVGNSTTEAVLVDAGTAPPTVLAADRVLTRGTKGSPESLDGAAALVGRLQRRVGRRVDLVAAAPQRPVLTRTVAMGQSAGHTGRLDVVPAEGDTPGGEGVGVGVPVSVTGPVRRLDRAVVVLVPARTGYAAAVAAVERWRVTGTPVAGVLLADDEGVLVASRVAGDVPVADLVDVDRVSGARLVAMEVRGPGHALAALADPIRLSSLLELPERERDDAVTAAEVLGDASRGIVALHESPLPASQDPSTTVWIGEGAEPRRLTPALLAPLPVGAVHRWLPGSTSGRTDVRGDPVDDVWAVSLHEVATSVGAPVGAATPRDLVAAALQSHAAASDPGRGLRERLDADVRVVPAEALAARAGALTTPGVREDAVVVDLGGGTVDVIDAAGTEVVAAGAGEMLTACVARCLQLPLGAADWVKRGPCSRVDSPQVVMSEDGTRTFLQRPAEAATVGMLVVDGPSGLLPFGAATAPATWRALRRRLKERVIAANVLRALSSAGTQPADLLLVGGAAGDEELLGLVRAALPDSAVGRADVAGSLGHRYAVAYGLAVLAGREGGPR